MAAAELLAVGTTTANSSDVVVAAGAQLSVCLKDAAGPAVLGGALVHISLKDDAGQYFRIGVLRSADPAVILAGAGTYRFSRVAGVSCGVFSA
jgi:hypothetical protein